MNLIKYNVSAYEVFPALVIGVTKNTLVLLELINVWKITYLTTIVHWSKCLFCVWLGHETKAMLNNGGPRYKRSNLERQMNLDVIWCVLILFVLCVIGAVGCKLWLSSYESYDNNSVPFIPLASSPVYEGFLSFWTFIIILQVRADILNVTFFGFCFYYRSLMVFCLPPEFHWISDKCSSSKHFQNMI